jgi:tetratricopeptide (TPR) repeat protein
MSDTTASGGRAWLAVGAAVALGVVGLVVFANQRKVTPRQSAPLEARLELAAGAVKVDHGSGPVPAISGTALPSRARVLAGKGSRALVRLSEGSTVFLRDDTTLELGSDGIILTAGELWMDAPATEHKPAVHHIQDVTVSAADAGLSLKRTGDDVSIYVARGLAVVAGPGGRVEVHAGEQALVKGKAAPEVKPVTFWEDWTGGMADHKALSSAAGAGTLYGVDIGGTPGSPARTLEVSRQAIRAVIRDGLAETEVDQTFFNPNARNVEGWYWFSVPEGATVTGFALETNGNLVEGELIERQEAAAQYAVAASSGHQPALLEWMDSHTFRARIFPVPAAGSRRVVTRYMQLIPFIDGTQRYVYPLQTREPVRIGELSLVVDLGEAGKAMDISTLADARIEDGGQRITMRRSGFKPLADFQLQARVRGKVPPVRVSRFAAGGQSADYVMARYVPDPDWDTLETQPGDIVLVVDTSAAGDEAGRQMKAAAAEAVLRALSANDHFALISLDVQPTILYPKAGLAAATDGEITAALERLADHPAGGATDLASLFDVALGLVHASEQPAIVYVGDGVATSGEMTGEQLGERLSRALSTSRARFFTLSVGSEANLSLLGELARAGGGQQFVLDNAEQTTERALRLAAAVKTPTITDFEMDLGAGLDEVFVSANGKISRGDEVILLARSHHDIPPTVKVKGRLAGKPFEKEYPTVFQQTVATSLVPRLWAAEAMHRLLGVVGEPESVRGKIIAMGVEYGLMTPFTSFIALDSEQSYRQQGIPRRRSALRGVRLSQLDPVVEERVLAQVGGRSLVTATLGCSRSQDAPAAVDGLAKSAKREALNEEYAADKAEPMPQPAVANMPARPMVAQEPPMPASSPPAEQNALGALKAVTSLATGGGGAVYGGANERRASGFKVSALKGGGPKDRRMDRGEMDEDARPKDLPPPPVIRAPIIREVTCSDAARRPLFERAILWERKLRTAYRPQDLINVYVQARTACELPDWRAESRFLLMLQRYISSEDSATTVLSWFGSMPESQKQLARWILRRAVDVKLILAVDRVLFGVGVDWQRVDAELAAIPDLEKRVARLREYVTQSPDDAEGVIRLCRLLARANHAPEALVQAHRLKERGLLNPLIVRELGDLLARQNLDEEAMRTYSEIVEFDPRNTASRRLLGDIYLAHGWYGPAYRQFKTLTEAEPNQWTGWLRLASAAAGSGRVDEALRVERHVAEAEGNPGPRDPRRWARLWSAARLSRLISSPPAGEADPKAVAEGMKRRLKELQLFQGPATLVVLTWEDLNVDVALSSTAGRSETQVGELVEAPEVGLSALFVPTADLKGLTLQARIRNGSPSRALKLVRHDITWDGKAFQVRIKDAAMNEARSVEL